MDDNNVRDSDKAPTKRKGRGPKLTAKRCRKFLEALAGTCNVRRSAAISGISPAALYLRRHRDPAFAQEWQAALSTGYARLEEAVLAYTLTSVEPVQPGDEIDAEQIDTEASSESETAHTGAPVALPTPSPEAVKLAMDLMAKHRNGAAGLGFDKRGRKRASSAETDAVLRHKLDVLARRIKAQLNHD